MHVLLVRRRTGDLLVIAGLSCFSGEEPKGNLLRSNTVWMS